MSSKHLNIIREKSYKHRKRWLLLKMENLKKYYDNVLSSFKQRLDNIVDPAINKAKTLLTESDEDEFLKEVYEAGVELEKCVNDLFDVNLFCCNGEAFTSDDDSDEPYPETKKNPFQTVNESQTNLDSTYRKVLNSSPFASPSKDCSLDRVSNSKKLFKARAKDIPLSNSFVDPEQNISALKTCEIDILVLLNIDCHEHIPVVVSDVISPSCFSVQPMECNNQLLGLQKSLNEFYNEAWTNKLKFGGKLEVGTICAALFRIDHQWYRAKILKELPENKYEVIYIDYGNCSIIKKDDLRMIDSTLGNVPQLSIQCSLFGVVPNLTKLEASSKWSHDAIEWFDQEVYGKKFVCKFFPKADSQLYPHYSTDLYGPCKSVDAKKSLSSISEYIVHMGFGCFTRDFQIYIEEKCENCNKENKLFETTSACSNENTSKRINQSLPSEACFSAPEEMSWSSQPNTNRPSKDVNYSKSLQDNGINHLQESSLDIQSVSTASSNRFSSRHSYSGDLVLPFSSCNSQKAKNSYKHLKDKSF